MFDYQYDDDGHLIDLHADIIRPIMESTENTFGTK